MMGFMQQPNPLHVNLEQGIADLNTESAVQRICTSSRRSECGCLSGAARQAGGDDNEITNPRHVKRFNQSLAGTDPVLIDAYGCIDYFAVKPQELAHVKFAAAAGVGEMDVEKATMAGRLRIFDLGQPTPTPTPTMTASPTHAPTATIITTPTMGPTPTPTRVPTNTPLPTPEPVATRAAAAVEGGRQRADERRRRSGVIPRGTLLPAATVVIGAGVVVRPRLDRKTAHGPEQAHPTHQRRRAMPRDTSDQ